MCCYYLCPFSNNHDGQSFDFGELEQAIVLQGLGAMNKLDHYEPKQSMCFSFFLVMCKIISHIISIKKN